MSTAYMIVAILTALWVGYSGASLAMRRRFIVKALTKYGVPRAWWPWLGAAKLAGATGILVGLWLPALGVLAGICLVLYFLGALITILRARSYSSIPGPLLYLTPVVATLLLGQAAGVTG